MTEPFRSELEAAHEKVRRAEERVAELEAEYAGLEGRLGFAQKPGRLLGLVVFFSVASAALIAWPMLTDLKAAQAKEVNAHARLGEAQRDLDSGEARRESCEQKSKECLLTLAPAPPPPYRDAPFDRGIAAVSMAQLPLQKCAHGTKGSFHFTITFNPDGSVESAKVDDGKLRADELDCVEATVKLYASVPPFGGGPVRVGKSWSW
jgi:hypothetical protein